MNDLTSAVMHGKLVAAKETFHLHFRSQLELAENTHLRERSVQVVSSTTRSGSTASLHSNNNIFSSLIKSNRVKLETNGTVILPHTVSVSE